MILHQYQQALAVFDYSPARPYRVAAYMAGCHVRLTDIDRARLSAAACLAMKPDFSVEHFMTKQSRFSKSPCHRSEPCRASCRTDSDIQDIALRETFRS